jgi:acyl-CoA thioesterase-1
MRISLIIFGTILAALLSVSCGTVKTQSNGNANRPLVLPADRADKPKIIAFGDSLTAGFGLAEKESYPYLLQQRLNADGFDYEVINAGVSGDTSLGGAERADWVLDQENAKVLILALGSNDLLRGMPVDKMKENLRGILEKAKAKKMKILICGMLAPSSVGVDYQRDFINTFTELSKEYKTELLPFMLTGVALDKKLNQADGIHPNAEGTKIMTENIYQKLKPLLENNRIS